MTIGICILLSFLYFYLSWVEGGYDVVISIRPDGGIGLEAKLRMNIFARLIYTINPYDIHDISAWSNVYTWDIRFYFIRNIYIYI